MTDLTAAIVSPGLLTSPTGAASAAELAKRGQIKQTSQKSSKASFLGVMLGQMFSGLETAAPFGGGPGEAMFKSLLTDAIAKKMTDNGGVGLAASVQREMLKMQGLTA